MGDEIPLFYLHWILTPLLIASYAIWTRGPEKGPDTEWYRLAIVGVLFSLITPALFVGYAVYPDYPQYTLLWEPLRPVMQFGFTALLAVCLGYLGWVAARAKHISRGLPRETYAAIWVFLGGIIGVFLFGAGSYAIYQRVLTGWMWKFVGVAQGLGDGTVDQVFGYETVAKHGWWIYLGFGIVIWTPIYAYKTREDHRRRRNVGGPIVALIIYCVCLLVFSSVNAVDSMLAFGREALGFGYSVRDWDLLRLGSWDWSNLSWPDLSSIEIQTPNAVTATQSWLERQYDRIKSALGA